MNLTPRTVIRRLVPSALRQPFGRAVYRARVSIARKTEPILGQSQLLAARSLVYNRSYYAETDLRQSVLYDRLAEALVALRMPSTVIDIGCGTGLLLEKLAARGVQVLGVEGSRAALRRATVPVVRANLERGVPQLGTFDLCLCLEVAEHLRAKTAPLLIEGLTGLSDTVIFTAAPPGQGGTAHINERPHAYWQSLFARNGFARSPLRKELLDAIAGCPEPRYIHANLMVFERFGQDSADIRS
jgi:SAM-dependent methyltransferase